MKAKINEIFPSIQGEGPLVGYKQLFIRFCNCNLHCNYCDTEFAAGTEYSPDALYQKIMKEYNLNGFHSISLTGGEPLLNAEFLKDFLPLVKGKTKVYLETNATLPEKLICIKQYVDIISADIKLESTAGFDRIKQHEAFFAQCTGINTFAKIVFDENITNEEISLCVSLAEKFGLELVLQPKMIGSKMSVTSEFCTEILDKFTGRHRETRLIPQVHKFLDVR